MSKLNFLVLAILEIDGDFVLYFSPVWTKNIRRRFRRVHVSGTFFKAIKDFKSGGILFPSCSEIVDFLSAQCLKLMFVETVSEGSLKRSFPFNQYLGYEFGGW